MFNKKSESGISTLIIFIAMILVASVAASVLILTSGSLQSTALDVGKRSTSSVSTGVDVISINGIDVDANRTLDNVSVLIKLMSGSDDINFDDFLLMYETTNHSETFSYLGAKNFTLEYILTADNHKEGVLASDELVTLRFSPSVSIVEDDEIGFTFVLATGYTKRVELTTPDYFGTSIVQLY